MSENAVKKLHHTNIHIVMDCMKMNKAYADNLAMLCILNRSYAGYSNGDLTLVAFMNQILECFKKPGTLFSLDMVVTLIKRISAENAARTAAFDLKDYIRTQTQTLLKDLTSIQLPQTYEIENMLAGGE